MMNTQIIAIANQKGGVGKTTTCANLGIGLAQAGRKVLLIDGDPQGSLTISLGHPQPDKLPFTLSDAMGRILMDEPLRPGEGILHHPEGVDLMPADIQLSGMEVSLVNAMSRETILRQYLDTLKGQYKAGGRQAVKKNSRKNKKVGCDFLKKWRMQVRGVFPLACTLTSSDTNHQVCSASGVITPLHQRYIARQIAALNRPLYFCCERSLRCLVLYQAVIHQLVSGHGMMKRSALL